MTTPLRFPLLVLIGCLLHGRCQTERLYKILLRYITDARRSDFGRIPQSDDRVSRISELTVLFLENVVLNSALAYTELTSGVVWAESIWGCQ
jgi:hypothetical protein